MRLLADKSVDDIFGKVTPVPGLIGATGSPQDALARLIGTGIKLFIIVAGITVLIYGLWGTYDYITSGGEKDKIEKARMKMTQAAVGFILIFVILAVFFVITGNLLGIVTLTNGSFSFKLPTLGQ
jgi:hypothetical protein